MIPCNAVTRELKGLFTEMAAADGSSIRPAQKLAYLALVTASDEQADVVTTESASKPSVQTTLERSTGSSDATLVNGDATPPVQALIRPFSPTPLSPPSVLGKRTSEDRDEVDELEEPTLGGVFATDQPLRTGTSDPSIGRALPTRSVGAVRSHSLPRPDAAPTDVQAANEHEPIMKSTSGRISPLPTEMTATQPLASAKDAASAESLPSSPPPLPHRTASTSVNVNMMFGRSFLAERGIQQPDDTLTGQQHDVSECMDNILFQVEASLGLQSDSKLEGDASNVIERCVPVNPITTLLGLTRNARCQPLLRQK